MRERKRDYPQRAYKYRLYLNPIITNFDSLPETLREEARKMRELWNTLIERWRESGIEYQQILSQQKELSRATTIEQSAHEAWNVAQGERSEAQVYLGLNTPDSAPYVTEQRAKAKALTGAVECLQLARAHAKAALKSELKIHADNFWKDCRDRIRASNLSWGNAEYVERQFEAYARQSSQQTTSRSPSSDSFSFRQRFTAGGLPVDRLFRSGGKFLRLWFDHCPAPFAYIHGRADSLKKKACRIPGGMIIAGTQLPFEIMLHRPLPTGGFVKTALFTGERTQPEYFSHHLHEPKWRFHLVLNIEIPHETFYRTSSISRTYAALSLGWRVQEKRLRFGYLTDVDGRRKEFFLPDTTIETWAFVKQQREEAAKLTQDLREHFADSSFYRSGDSREYPIIEQWLQGNILPWDLVHLENSGEIPGTFFREWAQKWSKADAQCRGVSLRLIRARNHHYRETANIICRQYDRLLLEDLPLQQTRKNQGKVIKIPQHYRRLAGLSFFIAYLHQSSAKWRTEICSIPTKEYVNSCSICHSPTEHESGFYIRCSGGHSMDYGENIGRHLLATSQ